MGEKEDGAARLADQPTRRVILGVVQQHRGLHKSELARVADIGWGNMGHHVRLLEAAGLVETEGRGRLAGVFDRGLGRQDKDFIVAVRKPLARRLLEALGLRQDATARSLSQDLDVPARAVRIHLHMLQSVGAVQRLDGPPPTFVKAQRK